MERFNTIKKLIVAPVLVIALTAGSAMAGPGHHSGGAAHHSAKIGQSEMSRDKAPQAAGVSATVTGKIVNLIANLSPLEATQDVGSSQEFPTVTGKVVNRIANLSPLEATQSAGDRSLDTGEKSLGSLTGGDDFYLDGEAHFLSVQAVQDNGFTDNSARVGETDGAIKQDAEQKVQDMSGGQYIDAFGDAVAGALKVKAWKDNPNKPPIGRHVGDTEFANTAQFGTSQSD